MTFNSLKSRFKKLFSFKTIGLRLWSVYFLFKFGLYFCSYIGFNFLLNLLLCVAMCLRPDNKKIRILYTLCLSFVAVALLYHDSYLPDLHQILVQKQNIADFSTIYIVQFLADFVNMHMILAIFILIIAVLLLKDWIRVTTVIYLLFCWVFCLNYDLLPTKEIQVITNNNSELEMNSDIPSQANSPTETNLGKYFDAFITHEKDRIITMPTQLGSSFVPFDIILINICSMANDDLAVSGLQMHQVFNRFDISFDNFNSAASYSTPASLRLLRANCGQETESEMYKTRKPECELITSLEAIGYSSSLYLDHTGEYGNYLSSLRNLGGLNAPINNLKELGIQYNSFDGSPIYSDKDLFDNYLRHMNNGNVQNNISFINLISLHDGNTLPNDHSPLSYNIRANKLLNDINELIDNLEKSNRRTMLIMIPEHGAALHGDKMQIAKLREIPNTKITHIPVYIKFVGLKQQNKSTQIKVRGNYSYLAISEIIRRVINDNVFNDENNNQNTLDLVVKDLPQSADVAESTNSFFMRYANKPFFMLKGDNWKPYVE